MNSGQNTLFYVTRPEIPSIVTISEHIKARLQTGDKQKCHIIFVPRRLASCEYVLEKEGHYGYVKMWDWNLRLIPLDAHLLSLEYPDTARTLYFDGNYSVLHSVAQSILALEKQFGTIPKIHGKGEFAKMVWELVGRMKEAIGESETPRSESITSKITDLVLFDRSCDWVTPLCSQLTYEGMLDDVFQVKSGCVEFDSNVTNEQSVKILLNEKDPVFSLIRSMHFSAVTNTLIQVSRELRVSYDRGRDHSQSIQEMKAFVKELPALREKHDSLAVHLKASENIIKLKKEKDFQRQLNIEWSILDLSDKTAVYDFIEECIQNQSDLHVPLQLLCLASATSDGIKSKYYVPFKRGFLHSYGYKHLVTFHNLAKVGLLKERDDHLSQRTTASSFKQLAQKLKLVPKDPSSKDLMQPSDASYVFGGAYTPLSCTVIEHVVRNGNWRAIEDASKNWVGPTFTQEQAVSQRNQTVAARQERRVVLVYFIGGCTFSEVSALRFMASKLNCQFIIATTDIINCKQTLGSFMEMELALL